MANYSKDDLLAAISQQIDQDRQFARDIQDAISTQRTNRLRQLIVEAATIIFGIAIETVITKVLQALASRRG